MYRHVTWVNCVNMNGANHLLCSDSELSRPFIELVMNPTHSKVKDLLVFGIDIIEMFICTTLARV